MADGSLHLLGDALQGTLLDQRSHVYGRVGTGVANLHGLHLLHQDVGELLLDVFLHIHALCIVAYLAVVAYAAVDYPLCGALQVGILADNGRGLASQFEANLCNVLRGGSD